MLKILTTAAVLLLAAASALARSAGPPDAHTGAPGELNCTACHTSFPLNSGTGSIAIDGVPGAWQPLTDYDITITLSDPDASRWGFEFTVLEPGGASTGTLATLDGNTQLSTTGNRTYAKHTSAGTQAGTTGSGSWTLRWTSPAAPVGAITLYVAANGANNNGFNTGDRIYTSSATWTQGAVSAAGLPAVADAVLQPAYPNPFNPRTTLAFDVARADVRARLVVYALDGSLVRVLLDERVGVGRHEAAWDGRDRRGRAMPSGVYLVRLEAGDVRAHRRMTLVR